MGIMRVMGVMGMKKRLEAGYWKLTPHSSLLTPHSSLLTYLCLNKYIYRGDLEKLI